MADTIQGKLGAIGCAYACRSPPRTKSRYASLVPYMTVPLLLHFRQHDPSIRVAFGLQGHYLP